MLEEYYIITFISSTIAMSAKFILATETGFRLIPLPTEIEATCGLCMKVEKEKFKEIFELIKYNQIEFDKVFHCKLSEEGLECTILTMRQPR